MDGDEETHDKLRGIPGNYNKCLRLYKILKDDNINVIFGITVSDKNSNFIEKKFNNYKNDIKAVTFVHNEGIYNVSNMIEDSKILKSMSIIYQHYIVNKIHQIIEKIHIKIAVIFLINQTYQNNLVNKLMVQFFHNI